MVPVPMTVEEQIDEEHRNLVAWRYAQLRLAGCDRYNANLISVRVDIELHDALHLLEHDCTPDLMVAILL